MEVAVTDLFQFFSQLIPLKSETSNTNKNKTMTYEEMDCEAQELVNECLPAEESPSTWQLQQVGQLSKEKFGIETINDAITAATNRQEAKEIILHQLIREKMDLTDPFKQELFSFLLNRWVLYTIDEIPAYVKHVYSGKRNVLLQIILSGSHWDGVYEFTLKGKKIKSNGYLIDDDQMLVIESPNNYGMALISQGSEEQTLSRTDFETPEAFLKALKDTQYITKEEIDLFYKPTYQQQKHLNRILPKVVFY